MKKQVHILLVMPLLSILSIWMSCSSASHEKMEIQEVNAVPEMTIAPPASEALEETFESDTLTAEQLTVFQQRGAEKLADFINYIEIISNKRYDKQLRLEIRKQIEGLFETPSTLVAIPITGNKESKMVSQFLDEIYKGTFDSIKVKTDSVVLSTPVKTTQPLKYEGSVSANVRIMVYRNNKLEFSSMELQRAKTHVIKVEKDFGGKKGRIWEVVLGEME